MKEKLQKAILNNNDLYEAIFGLHKIESTRTDSIWYCLEKTPPLYSNLVTLSKDWKPDEIFRTIDNNFKGQSWDEWSIKDSFGTLGLTEYGFKKLFNARWCYLEAAKFATLKTGKNLRYEIVNNKDLLSLWRIAWDSDEHLGKQIFHEELLKNPKVFFVAGYDEREIVSGCFINKTKDVLGISNFFAPDRRVDYWSDLIGFVFDSIEVTDIVGYKREDVLASLLPLGFGSIGDLTVWLKAN